MRRCARRLLYSEGGNVAPIVALSLVGLIAAGGLAFDYARVASLDTELQNAADQAALAAASQLDRDPNACERAVAAAMTLVTNQTLFANDNGGIAVKIGPTTGTPTASQLGGCNGDSTITYSATNPIRFWQNREKTTAATDDSNARFVEVTVNTRIAEYTLMPVVGRYNSGGINAIAFAGMGSAICKVPPLMLCNPSPGQPFNADNLPTDSTPGWRGVGLKLFMGGGNSWAPGAFGWLDVGAVNNGSPDQNAAIGLDYPNTNCVADAGVNVDTGVSASVLDALNVRFDIFHGAFASNTCFGHAYCSPAANATKDLMRMHLPSASSCGIHDAQWRLAPTADQYIASNTSGDDSNIKIMGYPMDVCHYPAGGSCGTVNQRFGNAIWRRDLYFTVNHPNRTLSNGTDWQSVTGLPTYATRYEFYKWEQDLTGNVGNDTGTLGNPLAVTYDFNGNNNDGDYYQRTGAVCKAGLSPGGTQPDRRITAAAVVDNCDELSGGSTAVEIASQGGWAEVFLVQPSLARPDTGVAANEIYVEIVGSSDPTDSGAAAQVVVRDVPYLIE